jgi:hypothetical protein
MTTTSELYSNLISIQSEINENDNKISYVFVLAENIVVFQSPRHWSNHSYLTGKLKAEHYTGWRYYSFDTDNCTVQSGTSWFVFFKNDENKKTWVFIPTQSETIGVNVPEAVKAFRDLIKSLNATRTQNKSMPNFGVADHVERNTKPWRD